MRCNNWCFPKIIVYFHCIYFIDSFWFLWRAVKVISIGGGFVSNREGVWWFTVTTPEVFSRKMFVPNLSFSMSTQQTGFAVPSLICA